MRFCYSDIAWQIFLVLQRISIIRIVYGLGYNHTFKTIQELKQLPSSSETCRYLGYPWLFWHKVAFTHTCIQFIVKTTKIIFSVSVLRCVCSWRWRVCFTIVSILRIKYLYNSIIILFDFSILYTAFPHEEFELKIRFDSIIRNSFIFNLNGNHGYKYLVLSQTEAYFVKEHYDSKGMYYEDGAWVSGRHTFVFFRERFSSR